MRENIGNLNQQRLGFVNSDGTIVPCNPDFDHVVIADRSGMIAYAINLEASSNQDPQAFAFPIDSRNRLMLTSLLREEIRDGNEEQYGPCLSGLRSIMRNENYVDVKGDKSSFVLRDITRKMNNMNNIQGR